MPKLSDRVSINGGPEIDAAAGMTGIAAGTKQLESIVSRIVRLENEKAEAAEAIAEIYQEAKSGGFNIKALKIVVKHALENSDKRDARVLAEQEAALMEARLGQMFDTPLGQAAMSPRAEAH